MRAARNQGLLIAATALSVAARGYHFAKEDQNLYLPFVLRRLDPGLFPGDPLLQQAFVGRSGAWTAVSWLAGAVDLRLLLLGLYLLCSYLVLWLTFKTALALWNDERSAWLAVVLWIPTFAVPGVANDTFDDYFTGRQVGTVFGMALFHAVLARRGAYGEFWALLGGLGHFISAVPAAASGALAHLVRRRWAEALWLAGGIVLAAAALLLAGGGSGVGLADRYAGAWRDAVLLADSELFVDRWIPWKWLPLAAYAVPLFGLYLWRKRAGLASESEGDVAWMGLGIVLAGGAGWAGSALDLVLPIQLCLMRGWLFLMWLLALTVAGLAAPLLSGRRWLEVLAGVWAAGSLLGGDSILVLLSPLALWGGAHAEAIGARLSSTLRTWPRRVAAAAALAALALWGGDLAFVLFGLNVDQWAAGNHGLLTAALFTLIAVLGWAVSPRLRSKGLAPAALVALAAIVLVAVPGRSLAGWIGEVKPLARLYGSRISMGVVQAAAERREAAFRREVAALVAREVPREAAVLVPPDWMWFRVATLRSPYVTFKDGAPAEFDRAYAAEWLRRVNRVGGIADPGGAARLDPSLDLTPEELCALAREEAPQHLDFAMTLREYPGLECLGRAGDFKLYRIAPKPDCESGKLEER